MSWKVALAIACVAVSCDGFGFSEACDPTSVDLSSFEVWRREAGYWFGEYTFLGADGAAYESESWNYPYAKYFGFIHIELEGNALKQRNVFVYPPQTAEACASDASATGAGACGLNGNEKIFAADQKASDCGGNLAGPYESGGVVLDTTTTVLGEDTVVYAVKLPADFGSGFIQNQLTTLPGNGVRVRTAQGFAFGSEKPDSCSFYRETKLAGRAEWLAKLAEVRATNAVRTEDECAWVSGGASEMTCEDHFGFALS
ncbi:hypothetical protein M885DRAFT_587323 [Pelagophyceae sp. CCMP2097]|nr:hypothetical protein M885DRAFT_587323 [Pelagophyceae sp. CCMP2097]